MIDFNIFGDLKTIKLTEFLNKPTSLTRGQLEASKELWVSADKKIRTGVWECTEGQFTADRSKIAEYCHIISGAALIENEDESKWVKLIHEWYKDGYSLQEIIDDLMNNGVLTRRGKPIWSSVSLFKLIQNTHYDGYWTYTDKKSGETIKVSCPRLVDPQTIREVKKSREGRSYGKGGTSRTSTSVTKYTYLLSKILICGDCGSPYYGNYSEKRVSYYHCSQKTNKYRDRQVKKLNCSKKEMLD